MKDLHRHSLGKITVFCLALMTQRPSSKVPHGLGTTQQGDASAPTPREHHVSACNVQEAVGFQQTSRSIQACFLGLRWLRRLQNARLQAPAGARAGNAVWERWRLITNGIAEGYADPVWRVVDVQELLPLLPPAPTLVADSAVLGPEPTGTRACVPDIGTHEGHVREEHFSNLSIFEFTIFINGEQGGETD